MEYTNSLALVYLNQARVYSSYGDMFDYISNHNRASVCMFVFLHVCGYVHVFLLDGLYLEQQTFGD